MLGQTAVDVVSFAGETWKLAVTAVGLVLSLRRWSSGGRSARLAAFGFGTGMLAVFLKVAAALVSAASVWTLYTPYSTDSSVEGSRINAIASLEAGAALASIAATSLLITALWTAWRRSDGRP